MAVHICQTPLVDQLPASEKRQRCVRAITVIKGGSVHIGIRSRVYRTPEPVLRVHLRADRRQKGSYGRLLLGFICVIGIKLLLDLRTVLHRIPHALVQTPYFILGHHRGNQGK